MSNHDSRAFELAVVGGGVIGLAVAWRAAQRGLRTVLLERAEPGRGTSWVAAGMLAPVTEASVTEQSLLRLGLASAALYPEFVAELEELAGADAGYLKCGTLVLARDGDEAQALARELEVRRSLGLAVERLRPSQVRTLEPAVAPNIRLGLEVAEDHAIDPRKLTSILVCAARSAGVDLRCGCEVTGIRVERGERVCGVELAAGQALAAEQVVVAAGVWSRSLAGVPPEAVVPVRPVKGQILRLHDPAGPGLVDRVLRMADGYLVPRGDGRYVLGATMEERGFDRTVTAQAAFELLRDATELVPGVGEFVIDELSAGLRPATPDNAPALGPGDPAGLCWATGHHRNGILLAPITAELVVSHLTGETTRELAEEFSPTRFMRTAVRA